MLNTLKLQLTFTLHFNVWTLQKHSRELTMQLMVLQDGELCFFPPYPVYGYPTPSRIEGVLFLSTVLFTLLLSVG